MNKKAESESLSVVGGLIISALVVVAIIALIYIILPKSSNEYTDAPQFYYQNVIKDLNDLKENSEKVLLVSLNENYILVGYNKNLNELNKNTLTDLCGKVNLAQNIAKPSSCQGNGCLCLCETDSSLLSLNSGLIVNCESEKSKCTSFKEGVVSDSSCNYFVYYSKDRKPKELLSKKVKDLIIIKPK